MSATIKRSDLSDLTEQDKKKLFEYLYPVGAIFETQCEDNPHEIFGRGTWKHIGDTMLSHVWKRVEDEDV